MAVLARIAYTNHVQAATTVLGASSYQAGFAPGVLRDQMPTRTVRTKLGWTIVAGFNDGIDFNRGGVKVATILPGTYATAALLCAAIVAALELADATPVWACTYSATTGKFTISSDLAFTLLFGTGANLATSAAKDIGFAVADTGSAVTQTGGSAVYQSRHSLHATLASAQAFTAALVTGHNAGTGGTLTLKWSNTSIAAARTAPTGSQVLAGNGDLRAAFFSSQSAKYLVLVIDDPGNVAGYSEVGVWFVGPDSQTSVSYSTAFQVDPEELSDVEMAVGGAHYQDERAIRDTWSVGWEEILDADRLILQAWETACPVGTNFFFAFDSVTNPVTETRYCFRAAALAKKYDGPAPTGQGYWTLSTRLAKALG